MTRTASELPVIRTRRPRTLDLSHFDFDDHTCLTSTSRLPLPQNDIPIIEEHGGGSAIFKTKSFHVTHPFTGGIGFLAKALLSTGKP